MVTKLRPPPTGLSIITRDRLSTVLDRAMANPLTLVIGPAGAGKTTALARWAADADQAVAWVSLDPDDNEPSRLWSHVLAALSDAGHSVLGLVESDDADTRRDFRAGVNVADALSNWFAGRDDSTVLVLDDIHLLTTSTALDGLDRLVSRAPRGLRLVLAGRTEPHLECLPRVRAGGLATHVGADALRFSRDETRTLLTARRVELSPEQIDVLHWRTEGWAAGICLLLAASDEEDRSGMLLDPQTTAALIPDYIATEVLGGLDQATRRFVLRTSVLTRLTGPLCDAVAGTDDGTRRLLELAQRTPLLAREGDRWYRHHRLLGALLHERLEQEEPTDVIAALHRRAARWFEAAGMPTEAIRHWVASDETRAVTRAVEVRPELSCFFEGLLLTHRDLPGTRRWIQGLPSPEVCSPPTRLAVAWTLLGLNRLDLADRWTPQVAAGDGLSDRDDIHAGALALRGVLHRLIGALDDAVTAARGALSLSRPGTPTYLPAMCALGPNLYWVGESDEARELLSIAIRHVEPPRALLPLVTDLGHLALIEEELGHADRAEELARRALALAAYHGMGTHFATSAARLARARLARGARALQLLGEAEASARHVGEPAVLIAILLERAAVQRRAGQDCAAAAAEREASIIAATGANQGALGAVFDRVAPTIRRAGGRAEFLRPFVTPLTGREASVLRLLRAGMTQREIGIELGVSVNTSKTHTKAIYRKLGAHDRDTALATARALQWIA